MSRWCLRRDRALSDDDRWNLGCTDEWGTHHSCNGCPHNQNMGDCSALTAKVTEDGLDIFH